MKLPEIGAPSAVNQAVMSLDGSMYSLAQIQQPASYIIQKIGTTYYAFPAPNSGLSPYSDNTPDLGALMNNVASALASTGGTVYWNKGIFNMATPFTWTHFYPLMIEAAGHQGAAAKPTSGAGGTFINWTGGTGQTIFNFNPGSFKVGHSVTLKGFSLRS